MKGDNLMRLSLSHGKDICKKKLMTIYQFSGKTEVLVIVHAQECRFMALQLTKLVECKNCVFGISKVNIYLTNVRSLRRVICTLYQQFLIPFYGYIVYIYMHIYTHMHIYSLTYMFKCEH